MAASSYKIQFLRTYMYFWVHFVFVFLAGIYFVRSLWKEKIVAACHPFGEGVDINVATTQGLSLNTTSQFAGLMFPKNIPKEITFGLLPPLLSCSRGSRCSVLCSNGIFRWHRPPMYIRAGFITSMVVKLINHWASKFSIVYIFGKAFMLGP